MRRSTRVSGSLPAAHNDSVDALPRMRRVWRWYLGVLLAGLPVYFLAVHGTAERAVFYVYGFSCAAAIVVGIRAHRPTRRRPWYAFASGLLLFAVGDVAFDVSSSTSVPSLADGLYLAGYPLLAWGMVLLVRYRSRGADLLSALDGLMAAIGVGVMAWVFIMSPYAHDRSLSLGARLVPIAYPALDLLLIAVVVRLLLSQGVRNRSFRLLATSMLGLLVSDGYFAFATVRHTYVDGSLIDLGWLLSYALWGAAALHPSMARLTDRSPATQAPRSRTALAVLTLAALASPVTLIIERLRGDSADVVLLSVCSGVMFLLVLTRLSLLTTALDRANRQQARLTAHQMALTDAAVAFVGAGDVTAVAQAAVRAAVALAGHPESWSSFVATGPGGPTVVAVAGPAPCCVGEPADAAVTAAGRCVIPVMADGRLQGSLEVGHSPVDGDAFLPALGLVCSQLSLALQGVEATEERLRSRNERQFRSLVQNSSDIVTLIGPDGVVSYQSPGVKMILGREADTLVGRSWTEQIHPDDASAAVGQLSRVLAQGLSATGNVECRVGHADGTWREIDTVITNLLDDTDVGALVLNSRDITVKRSLERELNQQAFHDSLTGLANRALFLDRVTHALDRGNRDAEPVAVLFLDVDDFKMVNDSLGHPAGDELLVGVAERLKSSIRPGDTVARIGGDEFAVLLESGPMPETAHSVARRVAEALSAPVRIGYQEVPVSASIGISLGTPAESGPDELLRNADLAMYLAKHNGKGGFEMFRPAMHEEAVRRLETTAELRRAIDGGQLEVFYQPIVDVHTSTLVGAEALVRWHHPHRGLLSPLEFIPIAESTGLVVPLGRWVLNEACRQAQAWRRSGTVEDSFYISVNLSARQLQDPALLDDVAAALRDSGLPAAAVVLEVTESAVMQDPEGALARLHALKDLGLRLAVDDFGTGHSSLSYLRNLPVDVVKIDKSFVDRLTLDTEGAAMVRGVIDLSTALGLTTIAEGVEAADQLTLLDDLGCDTVQGYLFAKPMPSQSFADAVRKLRSEVAPAPPRQRQAHGARVA